MKTKITSLAAIILLGAAAAHAGFISQVGSGGAIPDNAPGGVSFDIVIVSSEPILGSGNGNLILSLNNITHTWVGDLRFTLTHVDTGSTATIFDRPGVPGSGAGYNRNLNGTYVFGSAFSSVFETAANLGSNSDSIIPGGNYLPEGNLNIFNGEAAGGTWRLSAYDLAGADTSNANWTWTVDVQTVPEPGTWALIAGGLSALILRRRGR